MERSETQTLAVKNPQKGLERCDGSQEKSGSGSEEKVESQEEPGCMEHVQHNHCQRPKSHNRTTEAICDQAQQTRLFWPGPWPYPKLAR